MGAAVLIIGSAGFLVGVLKVVREALSISKKEKTLQERRRVAV